MSSKPDKLDSRPSGPPPGATMDEWEGNPDGITIFDTMVRHKSRDPPDLFRIRKRVTSNTSESYHSESISTEERISTPPLLRPHSSLQDDVSIETISTTLTTMVDRCKISGLRPSLFSLYRLTKQIQVMQWVDQQSYSISTVHLDSETIPTEDEVQTIGICRMVWFLDRWDHLVDPPVGVTIIPFIQSIPSGTPNSMKLLDITVANKNLQTAMFFTNPTVDNLDSLIVKPGYLKETNNQLITRQLTHITSTLYDITTQLSESKDSMVETAKSFLQGADLITGRMTAVNREVSQATEHKMIALIKLIEAGTTKTDTTLGGVVAGGIDVDPRCFTSRKSSSSETNSLSSRQQRYAERLRTQPQHRNITPF